MTVDEQHLPHPPNPPRIPNRLEPFSCAHDGEVEFAAFGPEDALAGIECRDITCERSTFSRTSLAGAVVAGATITDIDCSGIDASNLQARGSSLERITVTDSRAVGIALLEARLRDVAFEQSHLELARCRFARMERVSFRGCRLRDADLSNATLSSVSFEDCDLTGVDFTKATFRRCEIRGCMIDGVRGLVSLAGLAMPLPDVVELAPSLARAMGLHVLER